MLLAKMIVGLVLMFAWIKMIRMDVNDNRRTSENVGDLTW